MATKQDLERELARDRLDAYKRKRKAGTVTVRDHRQALADETLLDASRGGGGDFAARLVRLSGEARSRANWEHYRQEFRAELADPEKWDALPEPCQHSIAQAKRAVLGDAALQTHERRALSYREPVRRRAFAAQFSVR